MANQNFRVKNGLTVGTVEIANSSGVLNTSALPNSGVSAGSAGNTTTIPVVTVDAKGLVTGLSTASVSGVSSFTYTTSNATFSLGTGDGTTYAQTIPYANTTISGVIKLGDLLSVNATGFVSVDESSIDIHNLSGYVADENIDHTSITLTAGSGLTGGGTIAASRSFAIGQGTGITVTADAIETNDSEIVHDNLSGFVGNEHIDHSTVTLTAGNGLTGGGTIAANRTFTIQANTGVTANSEGLFTNDSEIVHDNLSGFVGNEHIDHTQVSLTAGSGLTGGGDISSSRTITVLANTGITANSTGVFTNDSEIDHDSLSGFVSNEHIDHTAVSITSGNGLTGGGDISATRTLAVTGGTGVTSNATGVHIGQDVGTTSSVTFDDVDVDGDLRDGSNRVFKVYDSTGTLIWG
jgi:hypothetical protein